MELKVVIIKNGDILRCHFVFISWTWSWMISRQQR